LRKKSSNVDVYVKYTCQFIYKCSINVSLSFNLSKKRIKRLLRGNELRLFPAIGRTTDTFSEVYNIKIAFIEITMVSECLCNIGIQQTLLLSLSLSLSLFVRSLLVTVMKQCLSKLLAGMANVIIGSLYARRRPEFRWCMWLSIQFVSFSFPLYLSLSLLLFFLV